MSAVADLLERAGQVVLPWWAKWLAIVALLLGAYGMGRLDEARANAGKVIHDTVTIVKHEVQVVTKVETKYRDRIRNIYVQGEQIENRIPEIIPPDVDRRLPLPAGFVRVLDAAWSGATVGPVTDSDREPAAVPPSLVAANETDNATSCRTWREQALGWREFYAKQQLAINGKSGDWYKPIE